MNGRAYLPPLDPRRPIANLRLLSSIAQAVAEELEAQVNVARHSGESWDRIAEALVGRYPSGARAPLGQLFPTGVSTTTVRRRYS